MSNRGLIQVLIIDDSPDDALLVERAMRKFGLSVVSVRVDTEAGLSEALVLRSWDVILCDNAMPYLDVPFVMAMVAAQPQPPPVIMITGTIGEEMVAEMMRRGIADVVLKVRLFDRLGSVVEREVGYARDRKVIELRNALNTAVLTAFGSAEDWQDAATKSMRELSLGFRASMAVLTEIQGPEHRMHQVTFWSEPLYAPLGHWLRLQRPKADESVAGRAMSDANGIILRDLGNFVGESRFAAPMRASGVRSQVSQPFQADNRIFIVTLLFSDERDDLAEVLIELAALANVLLPLLRRRVGEEERSLLRRALDAARSGVLITEATPLDLPGPSIVYANDAICEMSGHSEAMLVGRTPRVLQGPLTDPASRHRIRDALAEGAPVSVELQNHRLDGTPYWVELDITPVFDEEQLTHFIAIQTDITQRKADERERQDREASFRLLFESNPMPMWVCDFETLTFLEVNNAAVARYGWSREAFLALDASDVNPQADHNRDQIRMTASNGAPKMLSTTHFTATGEAMAVRVAGHPISWRGQNALLVVTWDVTEIERVRLDLRQKNKALAELTDTLTVRTAELVDAARLAGIGTWALKFEPHHVTWSPETFAILGRDPLQFRLDSESILSCIHPDDVATFRDGYYRLRESGTDHHIEYRILRPTGETRVVRELARPSHDGNGRVIGLAGVIHDITEQKQAADALLRAEKHKTIGQITGGIAHDFNNLLNVISLNLEQALDNPGIPAKLGELLEPALHAARRSAELTGQMLSYARRQSLRPVVTDVGVLIATLRPLLAHAVGERYDLQLSPLGSNVTAAIDPGQFENALMNLTINGRHALDDALAKGLEPLQRGGRGRIEITVASVHLQSTLVGQPDEVPPGPYARVRVADTGTGIPPEILPRIFEPFFTTKPLGTGSGLGLSMVYGFVHQSEGWLTINSTPSQGTAIELYFPLIGGAQPEVTAQPAAWQVRKLSGRVLLVEDRDDLRDTMQRLLSRLGLQVEAVASGEMALERLRSSEPVDLLFTDVLLPGGIDGPALAEAAVALRPGIEVLLTSGDANQVDKSRLKWSVLPKPFKITALVEALKVARGIRTS